jgi:hypothetical protein
MKGFKITRNEITLEDSGVGNKTHTTKVMHISVVILPAERRIKF